MRHKVNIWERDKSFGSRVDEVKFFNSKEEALKFIKEYNAQNTELTTPDWYMSAEYVEKS